MPNCEYKVGFLTPDGKCGAESELKDSHGRYLCQPHHDLWIAKRQAGQNLDYVFGRVRSTEIDPLEKLLYFLETDTGTALDLAECVQGCRNLVKKLRGK